MDINQTKQFIVDHLNALIHAVRNSPDRLAKNFPSLAGIVEAISDLSGFEEDELSQLQSDLKTLVRSVNMVSTGTASLKDIETAKAYLHRIGQIGGVRRNLRKRRDEDRRLTELNSMKVELEEKIAEANSKLNDLKNDLDSINSFRNEEMAKIALAKSVNYFRDIANGYKQTSNYWLGGSLGILILGVLLVCWLFKGWCFELACFQGVNDFNFDAVCIGCNRQVLYLEIFKAVTYRLVILSVLFLVFATAIKNYNACMHNYTVNQHKASSLDAALILLERSKTKKGNDDLMNQAVQAIFSHQQTGYNKRDNTDSVLQRLSSVIGAAKS